jgi:RNA polymerase sigma-70 factor (ECF subfamily)
LIVQIQIGKTLRRKADGSDVVHDALLKAHRYFAKFEGETEEELVAWLKTILESCLKKLVHSYYKTQKRDVRREQEWFDDVRDSARRLEERLVARFSSPSQSALKRDQGVQLANALARLKPDYALLLKQRYLEGKSNAEVARLMGKTERGIEAMLPRALKHLRREMDNGDNVQ